MTNRNLGSLIKLAGKFSFRPPATTPSDIERILPFRRSTTATLAIGVLLLAFTLPYFTIGLFSGESLDSLFDLVVLLFMVFWLMGWSAAVGLIALLFLATIFAQERLVLSQGKLHLRFELLGVGFSRSFDGDHIQDLKRVVPGQGDGAGWRGPHMQFLCNTAVVSFGSDVDSARAEEFTDLVISNVLVPAHADESEEQPVEEVQPLEKADRLQNEPVRIGAVSSIALVVANLVPLAGVVFLAWNIGDVMLLYWAESAVIGVYNLARMWVIGRWMVLFFGIFFLGHYGGFMVGHLLFIYGLMITDGETAVSLESVMGDFSALYPALIALFVSHGISFFLNFLGRREYEGMTLQQQMREPYKRIIIMHVTIIIGGFLVMAMENTLPALVLLILLKVGVDLRAHLGEHQHRAIV